ncbi:unnamed protein product [Closterium sp. NIES-54]
MYAVTDSAEGDCYLCVPLHLGNEAAALCAIASAAPGTGESAAPGAGESALSVSLANPSGGPVLAHSSTVLPCPAAPSGLLSGLHLPSFSTNLVSGADLQDPWADQLTPGGQRVTHCTCSRMGRHIATFTRRPGSSLYTLTTTSPPVTASGPRAAPHSSEFPPAEAPLQTLHMDVWGPARVRGQGLERYFLLVVDDYSRYTTVFPLHSKGEVTEVLIDWIRCTRRELSKSFGSDLPVLRLHSDRGGEFSFDLLRAFCRAEGIRQTFTLPASPQQNGIAERRIGMVMDVARTSMIHTVAPHFLWPFARTSCPPVPFPASSLASPLTHPGGSFTTPRRVVFCPLRTSRLTRSCPLRCVPGRPCRAGQGSCHSGAARGAEPAGAGTGGAEPGGVEPWGAESVGADSGRAEPGGAEPERVEPWGAEPGGTASGGAEPAGAGTGGAEPGVPVSEGAEPGGAEPTRVEPGGAEPWGAESGSAEPGGAEPGGAESGSAEPGGADPERAESGGPPGVSSRREPLSPQQLCEWYARRCRGAAGAAGAAGGAARAAGGAVGAGAAGGASGAAGGAAGTGAAGGAARGTGAAGGPAGVGAAGGAGAAGPGGAHTRGTRAAGAGGAAGAGARAVGGTGAVGAEGVVARDPGAEGYCVRAGRRVSRPRPPPVSGTHFMTLRPSTAPQRVPLPSPPASSFPDGPDPESDSLRAAHPAVTRFLAIVVTDPLFESTAASALVAELVDFAAACRLDYATSLVAESESASVCPPSVRGECALCTDVLEGRQEEFECFAAAVPHLVSMLLAPEGDPDALDIPTPRSYAEAIEGPYSSQWQAAMDAEMASWKSTGTYVDKVPPPGANIGVDFFLTFSPTPKMTTLRVLLHVAAQRDDELHSLDFSTAFLQGSHHEEIWLRRPPGFTGSFLAGTQWSLRPPVYGLRQAPREWHDTLSTTLAALGFAPSTADPSLFLRTDTTLPPFYVLVYVDDLVFATADTEALAHVKSELQKGHTCTDLAPPSDESVEPSGPYPELVGCLMYLMTCIRPDLAYPLSLLARYVAPSRHRKVHWDAAKRVLRYLCSTSGMGLVLGGRARVVLTGHADASWAEIYAGAMAAQELRWLTYLLTDLGEAPRSPPVLYVDNKAMLALCQEHRLEHRTKHIAPRYFLARELQQRGQLRLAYVASQADTADIFTKALQPCDHQRFCTVLGLVPTVPHLLTS